MTKPELRGQTDFPSPAPLLHPRRPQAHPRDRAAPLGTPPLPASRRLPAQALHKLWAQASPGALRCAANEFLDTIELSCMPCSTMGDANLIGDARHVDGHGNALSCRCPVGFEETTAECSEDCTDGTFTALRCGACNANASYTPALAARSACPAGVAPGAASIGCGSDAK